MTSYFATNGALKTANSVKSFFAVAFLDAPQGACRSSISRARACGALRGFHAPCAISPRSTTSKLVCEADYPLHECETLLPILYQELLYFLLCPPLRLQVILETILEHDHSASPR